MHDVHGAHLDFSIGESRLDRVLDLDLVGVRRHLENVFPLVAEDRALFRNDRAENGAVRVQAHAALTSEGTLARSAVSVRVNSETAASTRIRRGNLSRSRRFSPFGVTTCTWSRLRA